MTRGDGVMVGEDLALDGTIHGVIPRTTREAGAVLRTRQCTQDGGCLTMIRGMEDMVGTAAVMAEATVAGRTADMARREQLV